MLFFHRAFNNSGSLLALAALKALFPGISLIDRFLAPCGFSLIFRSEYPLSTEVEKMVEEKMRQIAKEKRLIERHEMVLQSAEGYLRNKGPYRPLPSGTMSSDRSALKRELAEVVTMGDMADWNEGPHVSHSGELFAASLFPISSIGARQYCLSGVVCPSKEEVKTFLKEWRHYPEKCHIALGCQQKFWQILDGEIVWLAPGLAALELFNRAIKKVLFQGCQEIWVPHRERAPELRRHFQQVVLAETFLHSLQCAPSLFGIGKGAGGVLDRSFSSWQIELRGEGQKPEWEHRFISSLQRIRKTLTILGFEHLLLLQGKFPKGFEALCTFLHEGGMPVQCEEDDRSSLFHVVAKDSLGRGWSLFQAEWNRKGFLICGAFEPLFALALEGGTIENMVKYIENQ